MQKKQPVRMCSGCAAHRPKRELVRVVRTPEGTILLDPGGKKSGRGAYLCPDAACLKKGEEGPGGWSARSTVRFPTRCMRAWSRNWGRRRMNDRLFSAISLCRKARRLRMGADVVRDNVLSGRGEAGASHKRHRRTLRAPCARHMRSGARAGAHASIHDAGVSPGCG